ncbi:MAG TPA: fluoride efflux transporter CrcB [Stellaceae bacterium]|nr:fluoride efflux transporter CrcB [Stellaceae bacterium]
MDWAWVIIGSALGGMARYGMSGAVARCIGETFPWGTLAVNASGSFVIGLFSALVAPGGTLAGEEAAGVFVMTGLCGGYTTFSSFSLQTLNLARDGEWSRALVNIVASAALCLLAVWAGFALGAFTSGG